MNAQSSPPHNNQPRRSTPRIVDATLTEALRNPGRILEQNDLEALTKALPLPGIAACAPLLPEGAYGAEQLLPAARRALMLEPLTPQAHVHAQRHIQRAEADQSPTPLPLAGSAATVRHVLVDPMAVPLEEADADPDDASEPLPPGWVRERAVILPAARDPVTQGGLPARTGAAGILPKLALLVARMPRNERLRIRDPHGALTPELAARLTGLADAPRLTLHLEDPDGLGPATARAALRSPRGPLVRTSLLGVGPRTGLPPTELFIPPGRSGTEPSTFHEAIESLQRHAGIHIPSAHPHWGSARHATVEPEHLADPQAQARANPATLPYILEVHLQQWGLELQDAPRRRILGRLLATLRPGEDVTGPLLWAVVAQEVDLEGHLREQET